MSQEHSPQPFIAMFFCDGKIIKEIVLPIPYKERITYYFFTSDKKIGVIGIPFPSIFDCRQRFELIWGKSSFMRAL